MLLEKLYAKKANFGSVKKEGKTMKTSATAVMNAEFKNSKEDYRKMVIHYRLAIRHLVKGTKYGVSGTVHMAKGIKMAPEAAVEKAAEKVAQAKTSWAVRKQGKLFRKLAKHEVVITRVKLRKEALEHLLSAQEETVAETTVSSQAMKAWELICAKYGVDGATTWIEQNPEMWEMMKGGEK